MQRTFRILKKIWVALIALQLLNLSICSEAYWDDFTYAYNSSSSYDPTETIMEWVIEMKCGQQSAFTYDNSVEKKISGKYFQWQTDLHRYGIILTRSGASDKFAFLHSTNKFKSPSIETLSPPPELA